MKNHIGKVCWQAHGYSSIKVGVVVAQKMQEKWLLVQVKWDRSGELTWEKILNVSFKIPKREV